MKSIRAKFEHMLNCFLKLKGLIGSCFALAFIAIIYEALKLLREKINSPKMRDQIYKINDNSDCQSKLKNHLHNMFSIKHFIKTFLHVLHILLFFHWSA